MTLLSPVLWFFMVLSRNWIILRERNVWKWRDVAEFERKELVKAWVQNSNVFDRTYDVYIYVGDWCWRQNWCWWQIRSIDIPRYPATTHTDSAEMSPKFEKLCHQHHLGQSQCIHFELEIEVRVYRSLRQASTALLIIAVISIIFR